MDRLAELDETLDGEVLHPGSPEYGELRRPAPARFRAVLPTAVVRCRSARDVVAAIGFARDVGMDIVPRGGGHCFAGRSSTEGLLVDLSGLAHVRVDPDGSGGTSIGAGARLEGVYETLGRSGRTLPAGCGPSVGIAGLTLGGGIGLLGRRFGLTSDALRGVSIAVADGRLLRVDDAHHAELFWALRGAGGGQFGIVTELEFDTIPDPRPTRLDVRWPGSAAARVIDGWQSWAPSAPEGITVNLSVRAERGSIAVRAFGASLLSRGETDAAIAALVSVTGPPADSRVEGGFTTAGLKRSFAGPTTGSAITTWSRSEFFDAPIPGPTIAHLLEVLGAGGDGTPRELAFTAMGGAYDARDADATAYAHRGQRFLLEHVAEHGDAWVHRSWRTSHPHGSGHVYANFPDPFLEDGARAYHGEHLPRLTAVREEYDPTRLFSFPQSL